jgi:hypothetical protein
MSNVALLPAGNVLPRCPQASVRTYMGGARRALRSTSFRRRRAFTATTSRAAFCKGERWRYSDESQPQTRQIRPTGSRGRTGEISPGGSQRGPRRA